MPNQRFCQCSEMVMDGFLHYNAGKIRYISWLRDGKTAAPRAAASLTLTHL